ncbi:MAG: hypothetical protein AAF802_33205 [Planctomycetota bacterium]
MIVASSAMVASVAAVIVAVYSASIDRASARAATWPHVEFYRSFTGTELSYAVSNRGTGPALIRYAVLEEDGTRYRTWRQWLEEGFRLPKRGFVQSHISTRVLSPDQEIRIIQINDPELSVEIRENASINLMLCYCSVFEQCWISDRNNRPEETDDCDSLPEDAFLQ